MSFGAPPTWILWITQFAASAITLALPPFFALKLPETFPGSPAWVAALAFALPLATGALMAPYWGRAADRFGRLPLTLRAHLGLAFALFLASHAQNAWQFLAAITLQGALGGTYASGRALLIEQVAPEARTRALIFFESAPRIALLLGPLAASFALDALLKPNTLRALSVVPLLCALLLLLIRPRTLPRHKLNATPSRSPAASTSIRPSLQIQLFALFLSGAILAPHALAWTLQQAPMTPPPIATLLVLMPNLIFVLFSVTPFRNVARFGTLPALLLQSLFMATLTLCHSIPTIAIARLGYSLLFVLNWQGIHDRILSEIPAQSAGQGAAALDALQRWSALGGAAVAALAIGLSSSALIHLPLFAALVAALVALPVAIEKSKPYTGEAYEALPNS